MAQERILVVDDEAPIVELCTELLSMYGYAVRGATCGREAIALLESEAPRGGFDLLVTDIRIPDVDGLTILRRGRELNPNLTAVIITGYGTLNTVIEALHAGAQRFVLKPFSNDDLLRAIEETLDQKRKERERVQLRAQLPLLEISHTLITEGNADLLVGRLLEIVAQQVGADRAVFLLPDPETGRWRVAAHIDGEAITPDQALPPELEQRLLQESRDTVFLAQNDVVLVLRSGRKPIGLLRLSRSEGDLKSSERNLLALMAGSIAAALENANLYREIRESRDYFRTVLDNLHDEIMVVDRQLVITDVNTTFLQRMGYERELIVGRPCYEVLQACTGLCVGGERSCPAARVWSTGQPVRLRHVRCSVARQPPRYMDITALPLHDSAGEMIGALHVLHDVTAEWELETTLTTVRKLGRSLVLSRDQAEIARLVVDAASKVLDFEWCDLWLVDKQANLLRLLASVGEADAEDMTALPLDGEQGVTTAVARSGRAIYLPDVRQDGKFIRRRPGTRSELCIPLLVQGRVLGVLNAESPRQDAFGHADRQILSTLADQAALALENARLYREVVQAEQEWAATFDAITDGISVHDADFRIVRANRSLAERMGVSAQDLIGQTCYTWFHGTDQPLDVCPHAQVMATGQPHSVEIEEPVLGGIFYVSAYPLTDEQGQVIGSVHVLKDITAQKRFQERLIQTEKLAALGRLAASLAHEINNPLQALRSGLSLLLKRVVDEKQQQYLQVASREVDRLIDITTRMLTFYRPSLDQQREPLNVNEVLDEVLILTGKQLQQGQVTVIRRLQPQLPLVMAVSDQLRQVFLNIILNALDAMPDGGTLTVASGVNRDAGEVWIAFTDTGGGIPVEDLTRVFEPLFSTKPRGTGLGLAISYSIIERHGGRIKVQSQVDRGSTFTILLPFQDPSPA